MRWFASLSIVWIAFDTTKMRRTTERRLSERGGSQLEWTAALCIFSVPALWNSSPTAHYHDAILHSPKQPLCSALHSKMWGLVSLNNEWKANTATVGNVKQIQGVQKKALMSQIARGSCKAPVAVGQISKPSGIGVRELLARGCD